MTNSGCTWLRSRWSYLCELLGYRGDPLVTGVRLGLWAVHCLLGVPATAGFPRWNMRLSLAPRWCGVQKLIYLFREKYEFELAYLAGALKPGQVFVDAGACLGVYSVLAGERTGATGRIFSFEPSAWSFRLLCRNVEINRAGNVRCFAVALSDREGTARLYHHRDPGSNSFAAADAGSAEFETVAMTRLDKVLAEEGVERVDFIKIDVEGAEELVLRGAVETLESSRPVVLFELNPPAAAGQGLAPGGALQLLASLGYSFFVAAEDGSLRPFPGLSGTGNVIAVPIGAAEN